VKATKNQKNFSASFFAAAGGGNPSSRMLRVHYGARSEGRNPERGEKRKLYNLAAGPGILRLRLRITFLYFLYEKIT